MDTFPLRQWRASRPLINWLSFRRLAFLPASRGTSRAAKQLQPPASALRNLLYAPPINKAAPISSALTTLSFRAIRSRTSDEDARRNLLLPFTTATSNAAQPLSER